jgi:hypothetical protein
VLKPLTSRNCRPLNRLGTMLDEVKVQSPASNGEVVKEASRTATNCPARNTHETTYLFPTPSKERGVPEDRTALGFTKGFSELE